MPYYYRRGGGFGLALVVVFGLAVAAAIYFRWLNFSAAGPEGGRPGTARLNAES